MFRRAIARRNQFDEGLTAHNVAPVFHLTFVAFFTHLHGCRPDPENQPLLEAGPCKCKGHTDVAEHRLLNSQVQAIRTLSAEVRVMPSQAKCGDCEKLLFPPRSEGGSRCECFSRQELEAYKQPPQDQDFESKSAAILSSIESQGQDFFENNICPALEWIVSHKDELRTVGSLGGLYFDPSLSGLPVVMMDTCFNRHGDGLDVELALCPTWMVYDRRWEAWHSLHHASKIVERLGEEFESGVVLLHMLGSTALAQRIFDAEVFEMKYRGLWPENVHYRETILDPEDGAPGKNANRRRLIRLQSDFILEDVLERER